MNQKDIKGKIKRYFFLNPTTKIRVRQIERVVNVPLPSVLRYTKELEKEEILKSTEIANIRTYSANRNSKWYILEKRLFNIRQLYSSGLINMLVETFSNPTIIVFGSYIRGEDIENSDIDLYIETPSKKKIKIEKFEKILKRKIEIFSHKNIRTVKNTELSNNIVNGMTLHGFIEVFK